MVSTLRKTRDMLENFIRQIVPTFKKMNSAASPPTPDQAGSANSGVKLREACLATEAFDLYDNSEFDRGAGRLKEALWVLCKCVFFLNPFPRPSSFRVALLRFLALGSAAARGHSLGREYLVSVALHRRRSRLDRRRKSIS